MRSAKSVWNQGSAVAVIVTARLLDCRNAPAPGAGRGVNYSELPSLFPGRPDGLCGTLSHSTGQRSCFLTPGPAGQTQPAKAPGNGHAAICERELTTRGLPRADGAG